MDLSQKRKLAMKTFGVGSKAILFLESRLGEIKDAITKQDIRDLQRSGAIVVRDIKGRSKVNRVISRSMGNIRKKNKDKKREYMILTRKLRLYLSDLHSRGEINKKELMGIRNRIKNREFRSKAHFKELVKKKAGGAGKK